jgi:hypothetical protein
VSLYAAWLLSLAGAWFAGRAARPASVDSPLRPPEVEASEVVHPRPVKAQLAPRVKRNILSRPLELSVPTDDEAAAQLEEYEAKQAYELVAGLRHKTRHTAAFMGGVSPEVAANAVQQYLQGWIDAMIRTAPDLVDDLSNEFVRGLCDESATQAELMVLGKLGQSMPEITSSSAFDCFLEQYEDEDPVMWAVLDAWQSSGLPRSEAIARLEATATDERTQRRFLPREELQAMRGGSAAHGGENEERSAPPPVSDGDQLGSPR